jgi:hypothetical protein
LILLNYPPKFRCYKKALNMLDEWSMASTRLVDSTLSKGKIPLSGKIGQEMQRLIDNIENILSEYEKAEAARILPPDSSIKATSKKATKISPLEMLSRGYLGEEIGALVNALRINLDEIKHAAKFAHKILVEIGKLDIEEQNFAESQNSSFELARELTKSFTENFSIKSLRDISDTSLSTSTPRSPSMKSAALKSRPPSSF